MTSYLIFTIENGRSAPGATVQRFKIPSADVEVPAILVGETGRGRDLGVLPVDGLDPLPDGAITITAASIAASRSGKPKLVASLTATSTEKVLVVFRTRPGFRGGCGHTGDCIGYACRCGRSGPEPSPEVCPGGTPERPGDSWHHEITYKFAPFPGEVIVRGRTAQGDAGRAGGGEQVVALVPAGAIFRTGYSGRLYGAPPCHYGRWDGQNLVMLTRAERDASDLF